jgi:hypothetical protein
MWEQHHSRTGITRAEYDAYLDGTDTAHLLLLHRVQRLEPLLTLEQIRAATAFQPPQSYRYLNRGMLHNLVNGHPASHSLLTMIQPDMHLAALPAGTCATDPPVRIVGAAADTSI